MDRQIIYPGAIPLETDLLNTNKNAMIGLSKLAAAILGTSTFLNGLACTPTGPASLQVYVAPGEIYSLQNVDGSAYSSIAADTTHAILKQGISLDQLTLSCPAPATAGQSVNYLIQVTYQDTDANSTVLPYYNSSNPSQAYAGPANSGTAQNTVRKSVCAVSVKAGVAATTGSQTTPAPDAGYIGAFVVTVANGQTQITAPNISTYAGAPFLPSGGIVVGGLQGNACNISAAGGTADAITGSYTPGITALTNGMTLYVRAGSANATTTPTFTPNSGTIAAKTIVKGAGSSLAAGDIAGGGHWIELQYDLALDKWVLLNPASGVSGRIRLSTNLTLYVSTTGSDSNTGLSVGSPFLTIQKAWNTLQQTYDLNGFSATIQLADGTYTAGLNAFGAILGATTQGSVILNGNASTPSNVFINIASAITAITCSAGALLTVQNMKLQSAGSLVTSSAGGCMNVGTGMVYGSCGAGYYQLGASGGGFLGLAGNYTINGGGAYHLYSASGGIIGTSGALTVTASGSPAFTAAFAYAQDASRINHSGTTYSGTVTGTRYQATLNGVINTNGAGASYFPGNVAGTTSTGGQYA